MGLAWRKWPRLPRWRSQLPGRLRSSTGSNLIKPARRGARPSDSKRQQWDWAGTAANQGARTGASPSAVAAGQEKGPQGLQSSRVLMGLSMRGPVCVARGAAKAPQSTGKKTGPGKPDRSTPEPLPTRSGGSGSSWILRGDAMQQTSGPTSQGKYTLTAAAGRTIAPAAKTRTAPSAWLCPGHPASAAFRCSG